MDLEKPSCSCPEFVAVQMPCKHMYAVIGEEWGRLPADYRACVEFNADAVFDEVTDIIFVITLLLKIF